MPIEKALEDLKKGRMAVIYDGEGREGEADLVFHARLATPEKVYTLRNDAGGLICLAIGASIAERLEIPFYTDLLRASRMPVSAMECKRTAYHDKPAFAVPINSRGVYTGITDSDRALTIRSFAELAENGRRDARERFMHEFYSPGHVFLLIGRGLENRRGHTELALALADRAGLSGAMVLCEMLGKGAALPMEKAREYAGKHNIAFIEGRDVK
jgi:3,4-dihydroxy 2-butanone 4-phosphate synthase